MTWPTTQVTTGDLVTAAQLNQLPIALAELSGAGASFDFTSIPQAWTHLLLVADVLTASGTSDLLRLRFNNHSGASDYSSNNVKGTGTTAAAVSEAGGTSAYAGMCSGSGSRRTTAVIFIPNYAAVLAHSLIAITGFNLASATTNIVAVATGGFTAITEAINQVTLYSGGGNFDANSMCTLYGMGAV
jgi:hypothetical protein